MPEYLAPGVYVEEFEIGAKPIEGVSTSTVGFLGETERGPTTPQFVSSWLQFQRVYGSYFSDTAYLPYAVQGFFSNGGARCYVARVVRSDSEPASVKLLAGDVNALTVEAVGEGLWGNNIQLVLSLGTFDDPGDENNRLFKIKVNYWKKGIPTGGDEPPPTLSELFDDLSVDEESPNYFENKVNGVSNLIKIIRKPAADGDPADSGAMPDLIAGNPDADPDADPPIPGDTTSGTTRALFGGTAGTGDIVSVDYRRDTATDDIPGSRKGLTAFKEIDDISIVYAPNANSVGGLVSDIIAHCESLRYRFAIIDADQADTDIPNLNPRNDFVTKYGAFYYPWIKLIDPLTQLKKAVPPGGHVAGIYSRSDNQRGVHKAPANEKINGIVDPEFIISKGEQDVLNPRGVNCIRAFPGRGIRVWGARTLSSDPLWKYINVRRLFIFLEASIDRGTQWVVFEPNNEALWARVKATITQFLTTIWRTGALMGTTPDEAFFVKCDRSTMTQDDIDNGRLIVIIGVSPTKPAEFVIFRIAQWTGGAS